MAITVNPNGDIIASVTEQIKELHDGADIQTGLDAILQELQNLQNLGPIPGDKTNLLDAVISQLQKVRNKTSTLQGSGSALGDLDTLEKLMAASPSDPKFLILSSVKSQIQALLSYRPDVASILADLDAMKSLKGGPADATAFHDFNTLQIAFENVWYHAFDENLKSKIADLYKAVGNSMDYYGINDPKNGNLDTLANTEDINDVNNLNDFIRNIQRMLSSIQSSIPELVLQYFPTAVPFWNELPPYIQNYVINRAVILHTYDDKAAGWPSELDYEVTNVTTSIGNYLNSNPSKTSQTPQGRIQALITEIGNLLSEPYSFDVFAEYAYNFGIMLTYRQEWEPISYQAGDLRATITLAPGESRKYSKKTNVKTTRAVKEIEKSMSTRSEQSSIISRAEAEIMQKTTTNTNFKMSANGSFNIGIGSIEASSEFALNQEQQSTINKKDFHESTLKAAEEYRLERSLEVDTTTYSETEETNSGEISNPNNEITVTYLFYELQRRYKISESLYRARPVILVAQPVPSPHEIDEAWLIQYQWILSRVLLDDSLRSALTYLNSGFAGDEVSVEVLKANWENQKSLLASLEAQVKAQLTTRDIYRESLVQSALDKSLAELAAKQDEAGAVGDVLNPGNALLGALTGGLSLAFKGGADISKIADDQAKIAALEVNRRATETRLQYTEQALSDAQDKLKQGTSAYQKATDQYSAALQNQFNRHVAIDQLRIHVKQNIIYYMQAIWDHEPPDQRYFRLYNTEIACPGHNQNLIDIAFQPDIVAPRGGLDIKTFQNTKALQSDVVLLKEIADLDNPLGYKGNYIIFPLKMPLLITTYMLQEFIDEKYGVKDPAEPALFAQWDSMINNDGSQMSFDDIAKNVIIPQLQNKNISPQLKQQITQEFIDYVNSKSGDVIIVPTGQLFIEALTGTHPVLEDFKLLHRAEDVRKVKAEVRHAELENLRLASRILENELGDPDIDKVIVVEGLKNVTVDAGQ